MNYDLISFDLDGTLVDTAAEIAEAANLALAAHGIAQRPLAEITALIGAGTRELMRRLLARCVEDQPSLAQRVPFDALMASFDDHYAQTTGTSAAPLPRTFRTGAPIFGCKIAAACSSSPFSPTAAALP